MMETSDLVAGGVKEKGKCSAMSFYGHAGRSECCSLRDIIQHCVSGLVKELG